jgi:hypothetical protein
MMNFFYIHHTAASVNLKQPAITRQPVSLLAPVNTPLCLLNLNSTGTTYQGHAIMNGLISRLIY